MSGIICRPRLLRAALRPALGLVAGRRPYSGSSSPGPDVASLAIRRTTSPKQPKDAEDLVFGKEFTGTSIPPPDTQWKSTC